MEMIYKLLIISVAFTSFSFLGSAEVGISSCEELQNIEDDLGSDYVLENDIDCSETVNWNGGSGFDPIGSSNNPLQVILMARDI